MRKILLLSLSALMLFGCGKKSSTPKLEDQISRFETEIEAYRHALHNTGLCVVVVRDNAIVYSQAFGYQNLASERPLSLDGLFRIASISKSFTTTSLMQLVDEGKVSLSADVSDLAGFPIRNPHHPDVPITLEMLLSHTSSICDDNGYFVLDVINPDKNPDWADCYRSYAPGENYEYCNLNLNLAGSFLEKLSGERFDQTVKHRILDPLGLYGGYCVDSLNPEMLVSLYQEPDYADMPLSDNFEAEQQAAYAAATCWLDTLRTDFFCVDEDAYAPRSERIANYTFGYDTPLFSPTGGMKLSALSLARYMMMHMNYGTTPDGVRILSEEAARNMQTPRSDEENYGLSLWKTEHYSPGVVLTGHTGDAYGMRSAMFFNPEEKYGFVVISNGALENTPESMALSDPSGSASGSKNILTCTLRLLYDCFIK